MLQLPNNCRAGEFTVFPSNWSSAKADIKCKWSVSYWFYDDNLKQRKKIVFKKINRFDTLKDRQDAVRDYITTEKVLLLKHEVNYISEKQIAVEDPNSDKLHPGSYFHKALTLALKKLTVRDSTRTDMTSCLKYIGMAIKSLGYDQLKISDIKRKHVREALDECENLKTTWTNSTYNNYRKYLSMIFTLLLEYEVVEFNPVKHISKKKIIKRIKVTLTKDERRKIDEYLKAQYYHKWRYMHIFFHSGSRSTELLSLQREHIDLDNRRFKVTVLKGKSACEQWRPIKDIVYHLWLELYEETQPRQYLFTKHMQPGDAPINAHQIQRWWRTHVKEKLKINVNFYALKHANTTEMMDHLVQLNYATSQVASMNGHTSETMVRKIYDVNHEERKHEILRKVNNPFV